MVSRMPSVNPITSGPQRSQSLLKMSGQNFGLIDRRTLTEALPDFLPSEGIIHVLFLCR